MSQWSSNSLTVDTTAFSSARNQAMSRFRIKIGILRILTEHIFLPISYLDNYGQVVHFILLKQILDYFIFIELFLASYRGRLVRSDC